MREVYPQPRQAGRPVVREEKVRKPFGWFRTRWQKAYQAKKGLELANEDRARNKIVCRAAFIVEERWQEPDPKQRQTY